MAFLFSCKGDKGSGPSPVTRTISVSLDKTALEMIPGGRDSVTITVVRSASQVGAVSFTIEGLPGTLSFQLGTPSTGGLATTIRLVVAAAAATAPGTFPVTVRAAASGVTDATVSGTVVVQPLPNVDIAATPAAVQLQQAASATVNVTLTRTNYNGSVALAVSGLPNGVTAALNPASTTGTTSTLTLTAAPGATTGLATLTLSTTPATSPPVARSTAIALTVTPTPVVEIALAPAALSLAQGASATVGVTLTRTNFTGAVALTATGLPTGVTATFNPASVTGTTSTLTLTASTGAATGTATASIRSTPAGGPPPAERSANLSLTVTPVFTAILDFSACPASERPVWLAKLDGDSAWTQVLGAGNVYTFTFAGDRSGYAWTKLNGTIPTVSVRYLTRAELTAGTTRPCAPAAPAPIRVTGTVVNAIGPSAIFFGGGAGVITTSPGNGPFTVFGARPGINTLLAYTTQERGFITRNLNIGNNGSVGTIDFAGANSFNADFVSVPVQNVGGDSLVAQEGYFVTTTDNACLALPLTRLEVTAFNNVIEAEMYGVPAARQISSDLHQAVFQATSPTSGAYREVSETFLGFLGRSTAPFVLPPAAPLPNVSAVNGPYKRLAAAVTNIPAEYNAHSSLTYSGGGTPVRTMDISATAAWRAAANLQLVTPNFASVAGWDNNWAPPTGPAVAWSVELEGSTGSVCPGGGRQVKGRRRGTS